MRDAGWFGNGGKHDWYTNPKTGISQPVPRHREVNEVLAKHILKKLVSWFSVLPAQVDILKE